ncbi:hypothetical protein [Sanguibacter suaedae]|uniref:Uncharacterized protein n=1 Tax=Sanguibacter suaedae TaxID=2795737 RepID=A0A934MBF8_9MICO|nr:hypothetical protein [Sanguibacter suaedae]MBI9115271.1 hypothetical protein [Sanguibacter suaedae]
MVNEPDELSENARRAVGAGCGLLGGLASAGIGLLLGGPVGALVSGAGAPVLTWAINDLADRVMSTRERERVGATFALAVEYLSEERGRGRYLRTDGFFSVQPDGTTPAHEAIEGVLLAAQREPAERKLQFYAKLLAMIAIDETITPTLASWMIKTAQELTWRQYLILALVQQKDKFVIPAIDMHQGKLDSWHTWGLTEEWRELGFGRREFLAAPSGTTPNGRLPITLGNANGFRISQGGALLYNCLGLPDIPKADIEALLDDLRTIESLRIGNV